jgi:hypothetical protein
MHKRNRGIPIQTDNYFLNKLDIQNAQVNSSSTIHEHQDTYSEKPMSDKQQFS